MKEGLSVNIISDRKMTLQSKAIYMYLIHISEGKTEFLIKSKTIQEELGIGSYQYHSHLRRLVDNGYIQLEQARDDKQRFSGLKCTIITGGKENG